MVAAAGVIIAAFAILVYGRVGLLHGKKFTLFVLTDAARGVIRGTDVWLDGQKVGVVKDVNFRTADSPPSERLVLVLSVLESERERVRRDSRVQVRAGASIIGDRVVYITSGTTNVGAVAIGDTIHAVEQADLEGMTSDAALASRELPAIMDNVKLLADQLETAQGTLGALGIERGGAETMQLRIRTSRVLARLSQSHGTVGRAWTEHGDLMGRASQIMARVDSIRTLVGSNQHSLGRFRRDSTLGIEIRRARAELAEVQRLASSPNGTIGRLRADSAIIRNVHRGLAEADSLIADIKKHPLRYIAF
jgi:phospholipid/cholesterol/gamma-HCH transport system substrate-binding protein